MPLLTATSLANLVAFNAPMTLPAAHCLLTLLPNSTNGSVNSNAITMASPIKLLITELGTHNCFQALFMLKALKNEEAAYNLKR